MRPFIKANGPGLQPRPISIIMDKSKLQTPSQPTYLRRHCPPSTCLGWASSQAQYPSPMGKPKTPPPSQPAPPPGKHLLEEASTTGETMEREAVVVVRRHPEDVVAIAGDRHDCPHGRSSSRQTMCQHRGRIRLQPRGATIAGLVSEEKVAGNEQWRTGDGGKTTFRRFNGMVNELIVRRGGTEARGGYACLKHLCEVCCNSPR